MKKLVTVMLLVVGVIHLLPVAGVAGAEKLGVLYGVAVSDPNLEILMRHRAVLFGLLGLFLCGAAFLPGWQPAALLAGLISVASFVWLAWSVGGYNAAIGRVVLADLIALVCLAVAGLAYVLHGRRGPAGMSARNSAA